jgi:hypothetical protein
MQLAVGGVNLLSVELRLGPNIPEKEKKRITTRPALSKSATKMKNDLHLKFINPLVHLINLYFPCVGIAYCGLTHARDGGG